MFGGNTYNHDPNELSSVEDEGDEDDSDGDFSPRFPINDLSNIAHHAHFLKVCQLLSNPQHL